MEEEVCKGNQVKFTRVNNDRGAEHEGCDYLAAWLEDDTGVRVAFCNKCGWISGDNETARHDTPDV